MKTVKIKTSAEMRALDLNALQNELAALRSEQLGLRLRVSSGEFKKFDRFKKLRKSIARILTIKEEKKNNG